MSLNNLLKNDKKSLYLISGFWGFTICIYAPFEMYFSNRQEFWFSLFNFWWVPIICGILFIGFLILSGELINRFVPKFFFTYKILLFALGMCFYVQGNFLNLDVGVVNGTEIEWGKYTAQFMRNAIIWVIIILICFVVARLKYILCIKIMNFVSAFFLMTQFVSLIILLFINFHMLGERADANFLSKKGLFEFSSEENIVIFLMDAFDDSYMKEIIEEDPEIKVEFKDFTYYANSTGSYPSTLYAEQYLLSGYYNLNTFQFDEWRRQLDQKHLYWDELVGSGWEYYLYVSSAGEIPPRIYTGAGNYENVPLIIKDWYSFIHDLYQFVACRYLPDFFKPRLWLDGSEFSECKAAAYDEYEAYSYFNKDFLEDLEENTLKRGDDGKVIKFIHLEGCHGPNYLNAEGEIQDFSAECVDSARGCLRIISRLSKQMKAVGCYDNSAILIMADHGYSKDGVLTNPVLMIKPQNTHMEEMKINNAPVSHADFPATLLQLGGVEDYEKYGSSVFDIQEDSDRLRYFYQYYYESERKNDNTLRLIEYVVLPEDNTRDNFKLTDVEYTVRGEKIQHSQYCKTCKSGGVTKEELQKYDPPREIHEKDSNYPD